MAKFKKYKTMDQKKATFAQLVYMEKLEHKLYDEEIPFDLEEQVRENRKNYNTMSRQDVADRIESLKNKLDEKIQRESDEGIEPKPEPATPKQISYAKSLQEKTGNFDDDLDGISKADISEVINKLKWM